MIYSDQLARVRQLAAMGPNDKMDMDTEDVKAVLSRLESAERLLHSIAITLGLDTWDDLPAGDSAAMLEAVERAMNARTLAAFVRGQRAGRAVEGKDPDALPESTREGVTKLLEKIITQTETSGIEYGIPSVAHMAREALRLLDAEALQTGAEIHNTFGEIVGQGPRCQSRHGDMQCDGKFGHVGSHQAGKAVWDHV